MPRTTQPRIPRNGDVSALLARGRAARAAAIAAAGRRAAGAAREIAGAALARYRRNRRRRAVINALGALSDATLRDIGLHRSQIGSMATDLLEAEAKAAAPAPATPRPRRRPAPAVGVPCNDNAGPLAA